MEEESKKHFILVHGMYHGAWCWYKLTTLLRAAGHRVTVPDLAACGVHPKRRHDLRSFSDYSEPLMEVISAIPAGERVVLVGHSYGGCSISLAMEKFADKVSAAIFVTAMMPSTTTPLSTIKQEFLMRHPLEHFMDNKVMISQDHEISRILGPNYMKERLYQLCAPEENYGSVRRVFVMCKEDLATKEDYQRWMIEQSPEVEVMEIEEADHMVMLSKPRELCSLLLEIAGKYQ